MYTVTYYKLGATWYLDLPEHLDKGGSEEDLEQFGDFYNLLEEAAKGGDTIIFHFDFIPFEGAAEATLAGSSGAEAGGYYYLSSFGGKEVNLEIWIDPLLLFKKKELPQRIYLKNMELA